MLFDTFEFLKKKKVCSSLEEFQFLKLQKLVRNLRGSSREYLIQFHFYGKSKNKNAQQISPFT